MPRRLLASRSHGWRCSSGKWPWSECITVQQWVTAWGTGFWAATNQATKHVSSSRGGLSSILLFSHKQALVCKSRAMFKQALCSGHVQPGKLSHNSFVILLQPCKPAHQLQPNAVRGSPRTSRLSPLLRSCGDVMPGALHRRSPPKACRPSQPCDATGPASPACRCTCCSCAAVRPAASSAWHASAAAAPPPPPASPPKDSQPLGSGSRAAAAAACWPELRFAVQQCQAQPCHELQSRWTNKLLIMLAHVPIHQSLPCVKQLPELHPETAHT
jgi:hypothetical protein